MSGGDRVATVHGLRWLMASASLNVAASIGSAVAGLVATGVMARQLPVQDFGRVMLMVTATNAFAIFEGLRPVVIVRVARGESSMPALFRAAGLINLLMAAVTLACLAAAGLFVGNGLPTTAWLALAATVPAFFATMQYWSFLDAEADTIFTGLARGAGWVVLYTGFAALALLGSGVEAYALALLVMNIGLLLVLRARFMRLGLVGRYVATAEPLALRTLMKPAVDNILFNLSAVTINLADRAVVGFGLGAAKAGLYAGPSELMLRAGGLVRAGMQVVLPWAARQSDAPGHRQRLWLLATSGAACLAGAVLIALLVLRQDVAALLLGESFRSTGNLLGLFAIAVFVSVIGYTSIAYLNARGDFATQRRFYAAAALTLLAGAMAAVTWGDLVAVACAFLLARCVDLALAARVLQECGPGERRRFLALAGALGIGMACAWQALTVPALAAWLVAVAAGASLARGGRGAS